MTTLKLVEPTQMAFNYDVLDRHVAMSVQAASQRISVRAKRMADDAAFIGADLLRIKTDLPHGMFGTWLEAEFPFSHKTATKWMEVARVYGDKIEAGSNIGSASIKLIEELVAPKTPVEVREEIEKMIEAGEVVTKATITELRSKLSCLEKAKALADEDAEQKAEKVASLETSMNETISVEVAKASDRIRKGFEDEIKRLNAQIADLKRPKPITTIDNETGTVVAFGRTLTDEEAAAIDAETDDYADADFNQTASAQDRATVFVAAIRSIASVNAKPEAIHAELTHECSDALIAENLAMLDTALSQIEAVKELFNDR